MTLSRMPEPDRTVLDRSDAIIKELETLIGVEGVISEEEGRRAFEADALTAYRQHSARRRAAALDGGRVEGPASTATRMR